MEKLNQLWIKVAIVVGLIILVGAILIIAPNFKKDENEGKINLIINQKNVTASLKSPVWIDENGIVYIAREDMQNFFDGQLYYDKENSQVITTSDTKVAILSTTEKKMKLNDVEMQLLATVVKKDGILYLPISEMGKVYNIEVENIENEVITVDSLDRELIKMDVTKKSNIQYNTKWISRTVDKVKQGDKVIFISEKEGWSKVRTQKGKIGYIKSEKLANQTYVRQKIEQKPQIEGKINLVWDFYSEYVSAPNRKGTTIEGINVVSPSFFSLKNSDNVSIIDNAARGGEAYLQWAKENGYKVWAMFSNNSMRETTSKILNDFEKRQELIRQIVSLALKYQVDGINVDFENMNMADKEMYSRFIIELAPRLREFGIVTSVDVTAPDGSENWSLCFDRNVLAKEADYLIFMAYDQHGVSSTSAGTVAGADWVEKNIKKFLGQEDVKKEKIILGMPLYTRLWKTDATGKLTSNVINMNKVEEKLPKNVEKKWDEATKQYYVEYEQDGNTYQIWIEDVRSIQEKLNLILQYELAGGAFWEKDRETQDIWTITAQALK